ncbi:SGNH/GDSL hydrolase family protein [uncultured Pseudodesulfovibrio sp.]|uniref:SGNH/GDSL hydrolase family protein n=1 Tax=uncultured Pseudodesulfovibrio sp. TaxID=2035858 RepID=UPI0029C6636C|nr:SGNH/GDSL hydrolase family protein [uncultured Pseudodesulfovibrio sp.]
MLYFSGNCQMDFLSRAVADHGFDVNYRVLASPLTLTSHPGQVPSELAGMVREMQLEAFFHGRLPNHQFQIITPDDPPPRLMVMNLFHENTPLFIHKQDKYIFFMDPVVWQSHPEMEAWMKAECGMIQPNPSTYLKRYGEMLATLRRMHPNLPIVVVSRLSPYPAFGPEPYSYLEGWDNFSSEAPTHLKVWERELGNIHTVDMNRIFGGIWREADTGIESHCPFLKFTLEETDGAITGLHAGRDVEHIGSMWPRLAEKIALFLKTGRIEYAENETIPTEWNRPWQPRKLNQTVMLNKLSSGGNYLCAEAVGGFFLDLATDYTELLSRTGHLTPVCHNTLHMIKTYGRIFRNPLMAAWCDAHRKTAERYTDGGPIYQKDYLGRIDEIKALVTD